ncbi:hypothetical protein AB4048_18940 [Rhizobium sp. RAF56]
MRRHVCSLACLLILASCNGGTSEPLQPIPGSITYGGQPRTKLTLSPIGTRMQHTFTDNWGREVVETYILQPDRSLKLVNRIYQTPPF